VCRTAAGFPTSTVPGTSTGPLALANRSVTVLHASGTGGRLPYVAPPMGASPDCSCWSARTATPFGGPSQHCPKEAVSPDCMERRAVCGEFRPRWTVSEESYLSSGGRPWPTGIMRDSIVNSIDSKKSSPSPLRVFCAGSGGPRPGGSHLGRDPPHNRRSPQFPAYPGPVDDPARRFAARAGHSLPEAASGTGIGVARTPMDQMETAARRLERFPIRWSIAGVGEVVAAFG
jgi:hypothetical protein